MSSFSGLHVSKDGQRFWAVTDKGHWATGRLIREGARLTGLALVDHGPLLDRDGAAVRGRNVDAEGLTRTPDGRFHVSFEDNHRVWSYDTFGGRASPRATHPDASVLQRNSSLEALASDGEGRLYTMPERSGLLERPFPVTRLDGQTWSRAFQIPRRPPFLLVGAEFGSDGGFYVLERAISPPFGFKVQLRRFAHSAGGLRDETVILERALGPQGNWEGLSLWRDAQGRQRLVVISDNNGHGFLATTLTEYILPVP
ncbi:MAG: esterase-like activity of phytase family protein [Pseudomonadota bacterium]